MISAIVKSGNSLRDFPEEKQQRRQKDKKEKWQETEAAEETNRPVFSMEEYLDQRTVLLQVQALKTAGNKAAFYLGQTVRQTVHLADITISDDTVVYKGFGPVIDIWV